MKFSKIPTATITRLSIYSRILRPWPRKGKNHRLGQAGPEVRHQPGQIRKDLAYFGEFGIRGVAISSRSCSSRSGASWASTKSGRWLWWDREPGSALLAIRILSARATSSWRSSTSTRPRWAGGCPAARPSTPWTTWRRWSKKRAWRSGHRHPGHQGANGGPAPHRFRRQSHPQFCPHPTYRCPKAWQWKTSISPSSWTTWPTI